jgi:hypothetical protein
MNIFHLDLEAVEAAGFRGLHGGGKVEKELA